MRTRKFSGMKFYEVEQVKSYFDAQLFALEYRLEGYYCRVVIDYESSNYNLYIAPGRHRMPKTLPNEPKKVRDKKHNLRVI